jgi:glycolate oxidase
MCRHACPTFLATKLDSHTPRGYALLLSQIDEGHRNWAPATVDRFYQCSQCGLCREDCEYHWREDELVRNAREEIVQKDYTPERVKKIATSIIQYGTPHQEERALVGIPAGVLDKPDADVLYFAGCSARYNQQSIIISLSRIFHAAGVDWAMLDDEGCCGASLYELGYTKEAKTCAEKLAAKISKARPKVLVTGCPHCFRAFKNMYPEWKVELPSELQIFHTSQYLQMLLSEGTLRLTEDWDATTTFCYHDPCQLGRNMQEYDAPRSLIERATGQAPLELFHNREHAECCGAGSIMFLTDPDIAQKVAKKRLERVEETQAGIMVTACQNCKTNLDTAQTGMENCVRVMDLAELLASRIQN